MQVATILAPSKTHPLAMAVLETNPGRFAKRTDLEELI